MMSQIILMNPFMIPSVSAEHFPTALLVIPLVNWKKKKEIQERT